jgi:hypothetical protein
MTPKNPASEFDGPSGGAHPIAVTTFQQLSKLRQRLLRLVQTFQKLTLVFSLHSAVLSFFRWERMDRDFRSTILAKT